MFNSYFMLVNEGFYLDRIVTYYVYNLDMLRAFRIALLELDIDYTYVKSEGTVYIGYFEFNPKTVAVLVSLGFRCADLFSSSELSVN